MDMEGCLLRIHYNSDQPQQHVSAPPAQKTPRNNGHTEVPTSKTFWGCQFAIVNSFRVCQFAIVNSFRGYNLRSSTRRRLHEIIRLPHLRNVQVWEQDNALVIAEIRYKFFRISLVSARIGSAHSWLANIHLDLRLIS